ncbi:MAG: arsenic transporter, partial [Elusimicrobia bacterium CG02_land_8_20_14_3_00_37_13]
MNTKILSLIIFIATYIFFIILPGKRTSVALASVAFLLSAGAISFKEAFFAINWNVMGIFVGTLIIADLFMDSGMPAYIAERIVNSSRNTAQAILSICILTGFISAVVENVATVLIIAPIALSLAKKLNINPVNMIISIAISSNLQGVATLVGDPPSMLLAGFAKMNFWDFFIYHGKPGIFFAVELGAIASIFVLFYIFKKHKEKISLVSVEKIKSLIPTVILVLLVVSLALSSFLSEGFSYAGAICMVLGFLGLIWDKIFNKSLLTKRIIVLDWETTLFLMGVFIIVGSLTVNGWIDAIALNLSNLIG